MTDDRMYELFRDLDPPLDPDWRFSDRLFEDLAGELGYRDRRSARRGLRGWQLGLVRLGSRPAFRVALRVALAGLILAALVGLLLATGSFLGSNVVLSGSAIVDRSQSLYSAPPAFDMTVRYATGDLRFRYDGAGDLRTDVLSGSDPASGAMTGSFSIDDGSKRAEYDAVSHVWSVNAVSPTRPALVSMSSLNWIAPVPWAAPSPAPRYSCDAWERLPDGSIAGRPAFHVVCESGTTPTGNPGVEAWIDADTFLLVGFGQDVVATRLVLGASDPSAFAIEKPAGAVAASSGPSSTVLSVGELAPDWSAPLIGGGSFDTVSLRGRPAAVYFWTDWCNPCLHESLDAFGQLSHASQFSGMTFVTVAWAPESDAAVAQAATSAGRLVVARDPGGDVLSAWGLRGVPTLVLLRADGTVASVSVGPISKPSLEPMLDALASDDAIPTAPMSPVP